MQIRNNYKLLTIYFSNGIIVNSAFLPDASLEITIDKLLRNVRPSGCLWFFSSSLAAFIILPSGFNSIMHFSWEDSIKIFLFNGWISIAVGEKLSILYFLLSSSNETLIRDSFENFFLAISNE